MENKISKSLAAIILAASMAVGTASAQNVDRAVLNMTIPFGADGVNLSQTKVGIAYERDNITSSNKVEGVGAELYTMPFNDFTFGSNIYGVLGNRTSQKILGVGYNQQNGINANVALRGDFLKVGAEYSLKNGLEGNLGVTSFSKLPENNAYLCPPYTHPVGNQCQL